MLRYGIRRFVLAMTGSFLLASTNSAFAQGSGHPAATAGHPGQRKIASATLPSTGSMDVSKRVRDWFAKYDNIRHEAQMAPSEKSDAHKLITAAFGGNDSEKGAAKKLLAKMALRYDRAVKELNALPQVSQTAELQLDYLKYFRTGAGFFKRYLSALNSKTSQPNVDALSSAHRQLATLDVDNKLLDKNLRSKYHVAPYKWD